ncbi:MAG: hypothetical protein WD696_05645 [Bryobacteraceae bacterium]
MRKLIVRQAVVALLAAAACGFCETEIPSIAPQVASVFPFGGHRGTEVEVEIRGSYLDQLSRIEFPDGQLDAEVISSQFRLIRARVRIAPDAEAGRHDFRVITAGGTFLGVFVVGVQAETGEAENNDTLRTAQPIPFPSVVNGQADGRDADHFRFHVQAGQTIVFDVNATRSGSALDPVLTLLDERGREIDYCDDYYTFKDARLVHTFRQQGEYTLVVSASFERSGRHAGYRLLATANPYPAGVLPLGGTRGQKVEIAVAGWNLGAIDRAWLGKNVAPAEIIQKTSTEVRLRLPIPATLAPGSYRLHLASGGQEASESVRFEVSDLPEVTMPDTIGSKPLVVKTPVIVNGRIPDSASDPLERVHLIEFEARKGARYEFVMDAWRLGARLDPVVTLFDSAGGVLAQEDDPAPNSFIHHPAGHDPRLTWVFADPGRYRLQVHDAAYRGGLGAAYRLTIRETEPDFWLEVRTAQLSAYPGRTASLLAVVHRTGGVHRVEAFKKPDSEIEHFRSVESDGWNTAIQVRAEGLPEGIVAEAATAEPKNTEFKGNDGEELFVDGTLLEIPFRVAPDARTGLYEIGVYAKGSFGGRTVERKGRIFHAGRALRAEPTFDQKLLITVVNPPPVLWNVPAEVRIEPGKTERVKIGVQRVRGNSSIAVQPASLHEGWTVENAVVPPGATEVEVLITANENAKPVVLVLTASFDDDGRRERAESPPIQLGGKP